MDEQFCPLEEGAGRKRMDDEVRAEIHEAFHTLMSKPTPFAAGHLVHTTLLYLLEVARGHDSDAKRASRVAAGIVHTIVSRLIYMK